MLVKMLVTRGTSVPVFGGGIRHAAAGEVVEVTPDQLPLFVGQQQGRLATEAEIKGAEPRAEAGLAGPPKNKAKL